MISFPHYQSYDYAYGGKQSESLSELDAQTLLPLHILPVVGASRMYWGITVRRASRRSDSQTQILTPGGSGISAYQDILAADNGERSNVTCTRDTR